MTQKGLPKNFKVHSKKQVEVTQNSFERRKIVVRSY